VTKLRVPGAALAAGTLVLPRDAAKYVSRVHRLGVGEELVMFDPEARTEADAVIVASGNDVSVRLGEPRASTRIPARQATLIQCVGKADKLDQVVREATELGATAVLPAIAERSVAHRAGAGALDRWRRIAIEAARQCGRGDVPTIAPPRPLVEVLAEAPAGSRVLLDPHGESPLRAYIVRAASAYTFAVGPEGGFSPAEIAVARQHGFVTARLGTFTLRTETVAAAVLGALAVVADGPCAEAL
jgi:16S rRNA (uracil1498-N3)-methyltransferase